MLDLGEAVRQPVLEQVERDARAAIAGVADDRQRLQLVEIHVTQHVIAPRRHDVEWNDGASHGRVAELPRLGQPADIQQPGVGAHRPRLFAHELEAVVVRRIVARGDHDAAVEPERERREVDALGAAQADVHDIHARVVEAADQRAGQLVAGETDVAANGHATRPQPVGISAADPVDGLRIQLLGHPPADVIGLEAARQVHVAHPLPKNPEIESTTCCNCASLSSG